MPLHGDYGFGSTPMLFTPTGCPALAAAEAKNGSVYVWQQEKLAIAPQRLQVAFPATLFGLPAWDPRSQTMFVTTTQRLQRLPLGPARVPHERELQAARSPGVRASARSLDSVPTVVNDTVMVGTGTGKLRIFATSDGKSLATLPVGRREFAPPISIGNDVVVASYGKGSASSAREVH